MERCMGLYSRSDYWRVPRCKDQPNAEGEYSRLDIAHHARISCCPFDLGRFVVIKE